VGLGANRVSVVLLLLYDGSSTLKVGWRTVQ
jgi:hypothetical protein